MLKRKLQQTVVHRKPSIEAGRADRPGIKCGSAFRPGSRSHRNLVKVGAVCVWMALGYGTCCIPAQAQEPPSSTTAEASLPEAPTAQSSASQDAPAPQPGEASIAGTVLDTNRDVIQNAEVTLKGAGGLVRTMQSGPNGEFSFTGLPPGSYKLTATGTGMGVYKSPSIQVKSGELHIAPDVVLPIAAASTSITVSGDKEVLAEQQVKIAEEQRVFGVLPNFYSSYIWDAPPMMAKQKYKLALRSLVDPVTFLTVAGIAGAEQYNGNYPGFGPGIQGYGKRYAAAYASDFTSHMLGSAVFASMFRQDPRYFYKGTGTGWQRTRYALSAAVMARTDDGKWRPAYAHLLGNFVAGGISNFYYPDTDRGVGLTLTNSLVNTAANAGSNLIREFVLKGITEHAGGKP